MCGEQSFIRKRIQSGQRFSPACAGSRGPERATTTTRPVQPRVCGEQLRPSLFCGSGVGSAPRVRGAASSACCNSSFQRFSPACAGSRGVKGTTPRSRPVQPRVCGEQQPDDTTRCCGHGSAPRVRGAALTNGAAAAGARFSPACAGSRSPVQRPRSRHPVQPRVCGEQMFSNRLGIEISGSAPRVRGAGAVPGDAVDGCRFSPACAGSSRTMSGIS